MSKCDSEGESRVMEMAEGSGKMQGQKGAEHVKSWSVWKTRGAESFETADSAH